LSTLIVLSVLHWQRHLLLIHHRQQRPVDFRIFVGEFLERGAAKKAQLRRRESQVKAARRICGEYRQDAGAIASEAMMDPLPRAQTYPQIDIPQPYPQARVVEKQRRKLNITWDDLIIPAPPDAERDMAAWFRSVAFPRRV
jgi:hypothetical protein